MSQDEISAIYKAKHDADKESWEQTRLLCFYMVTSTQGTEIKTKDGQIIELEKPTDLFHFPWDKVDELKAKPKAKRMTRDEFFEAAKRILNP